VIFGDKQNCLDPADVLSVYVPDLLTKQGEEMRLPFFVNRDDNQRLNYTWQVLEAPSGATGGVKNPAGETMLSGHEALYDNGKPASFRPQASGRYRFQVTVSTVGADPVTHEVGSSANHIVTITADGGSGGGCTVGGVGSSRAATAWLVL